MDEDGEVIELPYLTQQSDRVASPTQEQEVWKQWKNVSDAIDWGLAQLPNLSAEQLQQEFLALPTTDGKKAPAWVARVQELVLEQF